MRKILIIAAVMLFSCSAALAYNGDNPKSAFQLSFVTPLGTNGIRSPQYTNTVSFNILTGVSYNERAFTFAGLGNVIMNDATGLQFAGLFNYVGNTGKGLIFSGLASIVGSDYKGLQFSGLLNMSNNMDGLQFGGLLNLARDVRGLQFGGLMNSARNIEGLQFGGLVNISGDVRGLQFGGLINYARNIEGLQFGGLVNVSGDVRGIQFGGLVNKTHGITGLQFGGFANFAGNISGLQFAGLFNVAKNVCGVQFAGLVNVAENSDVPIGIINIIRNGEMGIGVTYDLTGSAMVSFRSGGMYTYGIFGLGYNHRVDGSPFTIEAGYGVHIPCTSWFRINNEFKATSIGANSNASVFVSNYSLLPAFKIGSHFELFAGPSINYMNDWNTDKQNIVIKNNLWEKRSGNTLQQLYIGYTVGAQFIF